MRETQGRWPNGQGGAKGRGCIGEQMKARSESRLLVHPSAGHGEYMHITPESAGWEHLSFAARRMTAGETWKETTGSSEYGLVILGGVCRIESTRGSWERIGRRPNVFQGMPYALYLPAETEFTVQAI